MKNKVVVIGGGASGLMAAITAARHGAKVTVLEHKDRVGKKILMTGNGKCNLTNMSDVREKYYSSDKASLNKIYNAIDIFDAIQAREFFKSLGLYTKEKKDGGVYPISEQASIVLDILRSACCELGVNLITECIVCTIVPAGTRGGKLKISQVNGSKKEDIFYDKLILATGSKAVPLTGSDGSGYTLAKSIGHKIIEPLPALVQLRCAEKFFKSISGVRAQSRLELFVNDNLASIQEGELQITDYGISGIPVFQFSRIAARAIYHKKKCYVKINFIPYISHQDKELLLNNMQNFQYKTMEELLSGLVHKKIAALICKINGISSSNTVENTKTEKIYACINNLENFQVQVISANSFENAQVCSGGVPLSEVDNNFQSMICTDVYIVGELLDCDGMCGGYNLQWAWATGAIAGKAAAEGS